MRGVAVVDLLELDDEPGKVYLFMLARDASKATVQTFAAGVSERFDEAEAVVCMGDIESSLRVEEVDPEEFAKLSDEELGDVREELA